MNTPQPSDITILDNLLALNLDISLWSARKKLTLEDFGNVELRPEDLATLGSKRIAPPESQRIFATLKARAFNFLDRHGIRFMSAGLSQKTRPLTLCENSWEFVTNLLWQRHSFSRNTTRPFRTG